jgi:Surface antigen variable number repeat
MKPALSVFCLLVTVTTASAEPAGQNAESASPSDISSVRVREVRFDGELAFEPDVLRSVLEDLQSRRVIPGVWTRRPLFEDRAVAADLARLRSFYISHGYFDARVKLGDMTVARREAIVTLSVHSGPKYAVRRVEFDGIDRARVQANVGEGGEFRGGSLCACLFDVRRTAGARGHIDFGVALDVSSADGAAPETAGKRVDVTVRVRPGSAYTIGRIKFSGHRRINDSTLRRAMALQERAVFDVGKLQASLAALNRSGLFEPLTLRDVEIGRNPDTLTADLTITVRERPGRSWSLSGPIGPAAFARSLQATISARLPPWGRGLFEASTYYVTFSLMGFVNPLARVLPIGARPGPPALLVLQRPYLPGQGLYSGFEFSPQLSVRSLLARYGLIHLDRTVQARFIGEQPDASGLLIPMLRPHPGGVGREADVARVLICQPPAPRYRWLRRVAALTADLTLGGF